MSEVIRKKVRYLINRPKLAGAGPQPTQARRAYYLIRYAIRAGIAGKKSEARAMPAPLC